MSEMGIRERVTNNLLLLYLINLTNSRGKVEDEIKLQKLVFLSQLGLVRKRLKAFSYNFFRWIKGPFSKNLRIDLQALAEANFVKINRNEIQVSGKAKELIKEFTEIFNQNRIFLGDIDRVVEKYATYSPDDIKDEVYSLKVMVPRIRQLMTIKEIPPRQLILFKTSDRKARGIFHIPSAWLATLEIVFDKEATSSLERAIDDAVEGRAHELTL